MTLQDFLDLVDSYQRGGLVLAHHRIDNVVGLSVEDNHLKFLAPDFEFNPREPEMARVISTSANLLRMNQPAFLVDPQKARFKSFVRGWVESSHMLTHVLVSAGTPMTSGLVSLEDPGWEIYVKLPEIAR